MLKAVAQYRLEKHPFTDKLNYEFTYRTQHSSVESILKDTNKLQINYKKMNLHYV